MSTPGQFVVSLDFELMWGMRDHATEASYGDAILGGRAALPHVLALFKRYGIRATWATVGFVHFGSKAELVGELPDIRPRYKDTSLDPYAIIDDLPADEGVAPCWYGKSLVDRVRATPGQEIGTHSFSHYYALEPDRNDAAYRADLGNAVAVAERRGLATRSIVFARNQYADADVATALDAGIAVYRGNPAHPIYRPMSASGQTASVRARRLLDALVPTGIDVSWDMVPQASAPYNVPASRFLRPSANPVLDALRTRRIIGEMTAAAKAGRMYHLWWHPHNFGRRTAPMLKALETILAHRAVLADRYGMESLNMGDFADRGLSAAPR